jgi:hypothetical protein
LNTACGCMAGPYFWIHNWPLAARLNNRPLNPGRTTLNRYMVVRFPVKVLSIKGQVVGGRGLHVRAAALWTL